MTGKAILKSLRKLYATFDPKKLDHRNWKLFSNKAYSNNLISNILSADSPCLIARLGSTELLCVKNYLGVAGRTDRSFAKYITFEVPAWWWEESVVKQMHQNAGFFPPEVSGLEKFSELLLEDVREIDLLGSWLNDEKYLEDELRLSKRVVLEDLEPFFASSPWTSVLEGKKVLVVSPFSEQIESQYAKRTKIFDNGLLPDFELKTIKAIQSIAGEQVDYADWFEALGYMKEQISGHDFDICILGCGAYGLPLAAHVKRIGKKAVHLGGVTQMLFGIKGRRWEELIVWPYMNLFNEHWVRPSTATRPVEASKVENGCYW